MSPSICINNFVDFNCSNFIKDYQNGLTPNPDILCNRQIKFNLFYKHAIEDMKCDAIATGHYARSSFGTFLEDYKKNKGMSIDLNIIHY